MPEPRKCVVVNDRTCDTCTACCFTHAVTAIQKRGSEARIATSDEVVVSTSNAPNSAVSFRAFGCKATAAFRPVQRHSLLAEAERWEHLALSELEAYFSACEGAQSVEQNWE